MRLEVPRTPQYLLRSEPLAMYLVDRGAAWVYYGAASRWDPSAYWTTEPAGAARRRIRNVQSGRYLSGAEARDDNGQPVVGLSSVPGEMTDSAWQLEPVSGGGVRLQSVLQPGKLIHVEQRRGYPELSALQPDSSSARWHLDWLPPRENKALLAAVSGSSELTGNELWRSRDGAPASEWSSHGEGVGAYLTYSWPSAQTLQELVVRDRAQTADHVSAAKVMFSDGSSLGIGALPDDGSPSAFKFPARSVTSLTFTITGVSPETTNAGLAELEVY